MKITSNEGEATLRRKESSRGGPRVTRNITEAEVMDQIHEICTNGHPYDKYTRDIELGNEPVTFVLIYIGLSTELVRKNRMNSCVRWLELV